MIDLLICSVPPGIINRPPAAPALLKACAIQAGFTAKTVDLSLMLFRKHCQGDYDLYDSVNTPFHPLVEWLPNQLIDDWFKDCMEVIDQHLPRFLGISVYSTWQHRATVMLCERVRQRFPDMKIILGGYGLAEHYMASYKNFRPITAKDKLMKFGDNLRQKNLVDFCIYGEGEQQLVDVLSGKDQSSNPVDLEWLPTSDFDDYPLDQYLWHTQPVLTVTGSKGCVRKCTFCNVPSKFGKYRRKTGQRIAQEIIELSEKYQIFKFELTDSLVNGSLNEFYEFVATMSAHNARSDQQIQWYGQYICRSQDEIPDGIYPLIKKSGAVNLVIGAESGSNDVLAAMNKKITVQDIFAELDQFEKHGLQAQLLVLSGFYNETWDRYLETLSFIANCHRYLAAGVISRIAVGMPLMIETDGYLHVNAEELGIILDEKHPNNWTTKSDPNFTWLERIRRRLIAQRLLDTMHVAMTGNGIAELQLMSKQLKAYEQQLRYPDSAIDIMLAESQPH